MSCKEHEITLKTIYDKINSFEFFTHDELVKEIMLNGGICRVSLMVTVRDHLEFLDTLGVIIHFSKERDVFYIKNPVFYTRFQGIVFTEKKIQTYLKETRETLGIKTETQLREKFGNQLVDKSPELMKLCANS